MQPLRISVVSYLNAEPFRDGLVIKPYEGFDISEDIPSVCAEKLLHGDADLGLVPVAMFPLLQEKGGHIVSNYCIGAEGKVASVMLFSEVPVNEIKTIYLDQESRTSVTLMRLLMRYHWKINPEILPESDLAEVKGSTARVLIGDRALLSRKKYPYETDLAESWQQFTGLPFVFACWVAMRPVSETEIIKLEEAFEAGLATRLAIAEKRDSQYPAVDLREYLLKNIRYELKASYREGLELFLRYLNEPENQSLLPFSRS